MLFLLFKPGLHSPCDPRSWCVIKSRYLDVLSATLLELAHLYAVCMSSLVLRFSSFLPLILMRVEIIRDNLISSLNHCDLVYSVSLARSTPVSFNHFYYFSFLFLPLCFSLAISRSVSEQCISITNATQEFKCSLRVLFCASPCFSFGSPLPSL